MASYVRPFDLFEDWHRPFNGLLGHDTAWHSAQDGPWVPAADIHQDNDGYVIEVEVPGFKAEQVKVDVSEGLLTILGERETDKESSDSGILRRERRRGRFVRRFNLPQGTTIDAISANVSDGVLVLRIPHPQAAPAKSIEVQ